MRGPAKFTLLILAASLGWSQEPDEAAYLSLLKFTDRPADPSFTPTVLKVADFYSSRYQYRKAADVLANAYQEQLHAFVDVKQTLPILEHLDAAYWLLRDQAKDAEVLGHLADYAISAAGPNSPIVARLLIEQATALDRAGDENGATTVQLRAAGILRNLYGADSYAAVSAFRRYARMKGDGHSVEPPAQPFEAAHRAGGGVTAPKLLRKVEPSYTEAARNAQLQGTVVLKVVVDELGMADDPIVIRFLGEGLEQAAIDAVRRWKFEPGMKDGKPVGVISNIEVNFLLK